MEKNWANYEDFLNLDICEFDQDEKWWRNICETKENITNFCISKWKYINQYLKAIFIIEKYLEKKNIEDTNQKYLLIFHLAQIYAIIWNRKFSLQFIDYLQKQNYQWIWKYYLEATKLFLLKDKNWLEKLAKNIDKNTFNYEIIIRLWENFELEYFEAYSGKTYEKILEAIENI